MKYVYSKYLYIINNDKMGIIMYSTKTGGIIYLEKNEYDEINSFLQGKKCESNIVHSLISNGFLVSCEMDESENLIDNYIFSIEKSKIFHLTIYLTEECNFNCGYCFVKKSGKTMTTETFEKIYCLLSNIISDFSEIDISWFGGEPLIKINELIEYNQRIYKLCKENNKKYHNFIVTNGYFLTPEIFVRLFNNGIRNIQVTFDGGKTNHDTIRVDKEDGASFDTILKNLRKIKKLAYEGYHITVRCNYKIEEKTNELKKFIKLYNKFFYNDRRFTLSIKPIVNYDETNENKLLSIYKGRADILCDIVQEYPEHVEILMELIMPRKYWCNFYSISSYVINSIGEIYICDSVINRNEFKIGFVLENGKIEVDEFFKPINNIKKRLKSELNGCIDCKRFPICYGSCNRIYHKTGKRACSFSDKDIKKLIQLYVDVFILEKMGEKNENKRNN